MTIMQGQPRRDTIRRAGGTVPPREPLGDPGPMSSQLEEARQLRDMLYVQIEIAAASGSCSISMTLDDAAALERLLTGSIEAADAMGAV